VFSLHSESVGENSLEILAIKSLFDAFSRSSAASINANVGVRDVRRPDTS
jgi:hypothetical protein